MKPKIIVTTILLIFVAGSIGYVALQPLQESAPLPVSDNQTPEAATQPVQEPEQVLVTYYLMGTKRCPTCLKIEAWTKEAVDEIKDGSVVFRIVNTDLPENQHHIEDYQLTFKTVVVTRSKATQVQDFRKLDDVWKHVRQDKATFFRFIQDNARAMLAQEPPK